MATIYYTAKVRGSRLLELPESATELELKPGEEIGVSVGDMRNTDFTSANSDGSGSQNGIRDCCNDRLRDEYRDLMLKKVRRQLTEDENTQLEAVRHQLNDLDRQSGVWSKMEEHILRVEQQLTDISRELGSDPDACPKNK